MFPALLLTAVDRAHVVMRPISQGHMEQEIFHLFIIMLGVSECNGEKLSKEVRGEVVLGPVSQQCPGSSKEARLVLTWGKADCRETGLSSKAPGDAQVTRSTPAPAQSLLTCCSLNQHSLTVWAAPRPPAREALPSTLTSSSAALPPTLMR